MKVSVIVPVYNTEKYLRRCLDSLVNQTLDDIEIIIIDDKSPDNSALIIDEYKKKYYKKIKKCERCVIYESIVNELFMKEEVIHG